MTLEIVRTYRSPGGGFWWTAVTDGAIWGYDPDGLTRFDLGSHDATRIDPRTGTTEEVGVAADGGIWVPGDNDIARIDAASFVVTDRIELGARPGDVLHSGDALWMSIPEHNSIVKVDLGTRSLTTIIPLKSATYRFAPIVEGDLIWTTSGRSVVAIDPISSQIVETIPVDHVIFRLIATDGSIWALGLTEVTRIKIAD